MRKRILAVAAVLLMGASFIPLRRAEAHNIDLDKAQEVAREFARTIRKESNGNYLHYSTKCGKAFPGHNHIVKCDVEYQNEKDTKAGVYTCKETLEIYFYAHGRSNTYNYVFKIRHTSGNICGNRQPGVDYTG